MNIFEMNVNEIDDIMNNILNGRVRCKFRFQIE